MSFKNVLIDSPKCLYTIHNKLIVSVLTLAFLLSHHETAKLITSCAGQPSGPNSSISKPIQMLFSIITFGFVAPAVFLTMYLITKPGDTSSDNESKASLQRSLYFVLPMLSDKNGIMMTAAFLGSQVELLTISYTHWIAALTMLKFCSLKSLSLIFINQNDASYSSPEYSCSDSHAANLV